MCERCEKCKDMGLNIKGNYCIFEEIIGYSVFKDNKGKCEKVANKEEKEQAINEYKNECKIANKLQHI